MQTEVAASTLRSGREPWSQGQGPLDRSCFFNNDGKNVHDFDMCEQMLYMCKQILYTMFTYAQKNDTNAPSQNLQN